MPVFHVHLTIYTDKNDDEATITCTSGPELTQTTTTVEPVSPPKKDEAKAKTQRTDAAPPSVGSGCQSGNAGPTPCEDGHPHTKIADAPPINTPPIDAVFEARRAVRLLSAAKGLDAAKEILVGKYGATCVSTLPESKLLQFAEDCTRAAKENGN